MATIKDVAKLADVSVSTVSNIINNKYNSGNDIYDRVMAAIKKLDYRPSVNARSLKKNNTHCIGVILPNVRGHYGDILEGILSAVSATPYQVMVRTTSDLEVSEKNAIDELLYLDIKGLLLVSCNSRFPAKVDIPCVLMERRFDNTDCSYVVFDNRTIMNEYTKSILAESDDRELVLISGPSRYSCEREYITGFEQALKDYKIDTAGRVIEVLLSESNAFTAFIEMLPKHPAADFIVTNEIIARCLCEAAEILKMKNTIHTIMGNAWQRFLPEDRFKTLSLNSSHCGKEALSILLKWIASPVKYESNQVVLKRNFEASEKIYVPVVNRPKKLKLLLYKNSSISAIFRLLPNFTNYFGIDIEYEVHPYNELMKLVFNEARFKSDQYDVVMIDSPWYENLISKGYLTKLSPFLKADEDGFIANFDPNVWNKLIKSSVDVYALPYMIGTQLLFYRADVFNDPSIKRAYYSQYGIELNPPQTWSEFNFIAKFFTRSYNPNSPFLYGTSMGEPFADVSTQFITRQKAYHGCFFNPKGELEVNSIQNLKALNNLIESYNYSDPKDPVYDPIKDLLDGTIALLIAFGNHIVNVYGDTLRSMRESIGIAPVPGSYPMLSDWRLAVNENSHSKEAAYRFIKWACSNKLSVNNAFLGGIIPQNSVFDCYRLNVEYPWYNAMYEQIPNGIVREVIWTKRGHMVNANEFEDIFASLVNDARKNNISIDQILPIAEKRFYEYVEKIEKQGESR